MITDEVLKNWSYAHAHSDGLAVEIGLRDVPAFYYAQTDAIYLAKGADNADELIRIGKTQKAFSGKIERPHYKYGIVRNGRGIGDCYFAITAGYHWAIANNYPLDEVCIMLQPLVAKIYKNFGWWHEGRYIKPNIVAIPVVEDDLAARFFDVWFSGFDDYVIFDCTVESSYLRWFKDLRYLATKAQRNRHPADLDWYGENFRVAGLPPTKPDLCYVPHHNLFDADFAKNITGKVVWHTRGSDVSKWYPHMLKTAHQLRERGIETVFVGAPYDNQFVEQLGLAKEFVVLTHQDPAAMVALIQHGSPLAYIGQETGFSAMVSLMDVQKIILISHTEPARFTGWRNATFLTADNPPPCWPCYVPNSDFTRCTMDKATKAAKCQADITPEQIINAITINKATQHNDLMG